MKICIYLHCECKKYHIESDTWKNYLSNSRLWFYWKDFFLMLHATLCSSKFIVIPINMMLLLVKKDFSFSLKMNVLFVIKIFKHIFLNKFYCYYNCFHISGEFLIGILLMFFLLLFVCFGFFFFVCSFYRSLFFFLLDCYCSLDVIFVH